MASAVQIRERRGPATLYRRMGAKLGLDSLQSDRDLARVVQQRLPVSSVAALRAHGLSEAEIYQLIVPRRTLVHRKTRKEALTQDESDKAVRIARIASMAEEIFGDNAKAGRWLRKAKVRFEQRSPLDMLMTEAGARLVEEMLLQLDYGFTA